MALRIAWTKEDEKRLRQNRKMPIRELAELFKGRTPGAIRQKAFTLDISLQGGRSAQKKAPAKSRRPAQKKAPARKRAA